jgi:hypothetical protein
MSQVLGEELFDLSGLSVIQVWRYCCNHFLQLQSSLGPVWLAHSMQGGTRLWASGHDGYIHNPHRYLPAVLDQGPVSIKSFRQMGLWTWFYQAIFHSEGALQSSHHHSFSLCNYHLMNGHYHAGRPGPSCDISSSVRCSIWCSRSTDALYTCRMPSLKMNLFVLMASTQIFSGRPPQGQCLENFLQDGVGFP